MNKLYAGFGRADITPPLGMFLHGYFHDRMAEGVLDELSVNVLALQVEHTKALLVILDVGGVQKSDINIIRDEISKTTGVPAEAIYLATTHTHTGPEVYSMPEESTHLVNSGPHADVQQKNDRIRNYFVSMKIGVLNAAHQALANLKPARMGWRVGTATDIAFNRRFRMKDGTVRSSPGHMNPDIVEAIGVVDDRVSMVRFDQEGGDNIVLVHYGMHPDTIGGSKVSADWPGFVRRTVERAIPGTKCLFLNGPQGDIGAQNVWATDGMLNDWHITPGDYLKGYGHTQYIGMVIAGAVLQVYSKANYRDVETLSIVEKEIRVPSNKPTPEELAEADRILALHNAGKDDEIPFTAMELVTVLGEANRMDGLRNAPETFPLHLMGLRVADVALVGIPGEPFGRAGVEIRKAPDWELILPSCTSNGYEGYFPMMECYEEGGYEARSSRYKAGTAEQIVEECTTLLAEMRNL